MDTELPLITGGPAPPLCYKCRRISAATVFERGGYYHGGRLEEIARSASGCAMCGAIHKGLLADIAVKFEDEQDLVNDSIIVQPGLWDPSNLSSRSGLYVRCLTTNLTCIFNWYIPRDGIIYFPLF